VPQSGVAALKCLYKQLLKNFLWSFSTPNLSKSTTIEPNTPQTSNKVVSSLLGRRAKNAQAEPSYDNESKEYKDTKSLVKGALDNPQGPSAAQLKGRDVQGLLKQVYIDVAKEDQARLNSGKAEPKEKVRLTNRLNNLKESHPKIHQEAIEPKTKPLMDRLFKRG